VSPFYDESLTCPCKRNKELGVGLTPQKRSMGRLPDDPNRKGKGGWGARTQEWPERKVCLEFGRGHLGDARRERRAVGGGGA
jgi:hypothetical protein